MTSGSASSLGWPKWKVAVAVGAPIALGTAGVWLYKRSVSSAAAVVSKTSETIAVEDVRTIPQAR